jgi:hypothetical protein
VYCSPSTGLAHYEAEEEVLAVEQWKIAIKEQIRKKYARET